MKKPQGKIDWTIAEDDAAWQASQNAAQLETSPSPHRRQQFALALTAAALLLLMGGWLWPHSAPAQGAIQKLTPTAVQASALTGMQAERSLTQTIELLGKSLRVDKLQCNGDGVMAQVTVDYHEEGSTRAYRETRFYQKSASGQPIPWQRVAPDPALLGPQKTLQIANFTILYRAIDADAVYEAAPKVEQLYATLRHDFGLPVAEAASTYTIEVAVEGVQSATNYVYLQRRMSVSSPILLSAPVEMPPATLLYEAIIYPLARLTLNESMDQHGALWKSHFYSWPSAFDALALWELWEAGGPLASGREPVVRWLYEESKSKTTQRSLPDEYIALCRTYHVWQLIPYDFSIPLICSAVDTTMALSNSYPSLASTSNSYPSLGSTWPQPTITHGMGAPLLESPDSAPVTIESILEYIVATYGRDKVPQLVAALGQHTSPDTLIPALFGVSQSDFETGWQAYLAGLGSKK